LGQPHLFDFPKTPHPDNAIAATKNNKTDIWFIFFIFNYPKLRFFKNKKSSIVQVTEKINITVLVAPLDWGLGHCTRCIPLVRYLIHRGCKVLLAAEGAQAKLLSIEFPSLEILPLQGYRISYSKSKRWFPFKIMGQLPKIVNAVRSEHLWLQEVVESRNVDVVISDNRYGLYHQQVSTVIITHQLQVQFPFKWMLQIGMRFLYKYINKFDACWVPDNMGEPNLAGSLSHPPVMPSVPVEYVGPLSRMENIQQAKRYDVLFLLSGPEPQRTLLEEKIKKQLQAFKGSAFLIRGLPMQEQSLGLAGNIHVINHLPSTELQQAIAESEMVVCRSGYSSVMDLCVMQKKMILIPTPGQTEQEYLAKHLHAQGLCLYFLQEEFELEIALEKASSFKFQQLAFRMDQYKKSYRWIAC
jgi:uncharacterized protein (TIGR00661 family)